MLWETVNYVFMYYEGGGSRWEVVPQLLPTIKKIIYHVFFVRWRVINRVFRERTYPIQASFIEACWARLGTHTLSIIWGTWYCQSDNCVIAFLKHRVILAVIPNIWYVFHRSLLRTAWYAYIVYYLWDMVSATLTIVW